MTEAGRRPCKSLAEQCRRDSGGMQSMRAGGRDALQDFCKDGSPPGPGPPPPPPPPSLAACPLARRTQWEGPVKLTSKREKEKAGCKFIPLASLIQSRARRRPGRGGGLVSSQKELARAGGVEGQVAPSEQVTR
uniref:Uncharacterized protein n=1 Tax=Sphaerodactylus townsendi TaxID=933632 RepID=A0ACB8E6B3_9SAUR